MIMYSLVAMEKFAQTSENKVTIQRRLAREEEHPLLSLEVLASEEDCPRRQVGFCARWSLDNLCKYNFPKCYIFLLMQFRFPLPQSCSPTGPSRIWSKT